jgi:hypothetical protein
MTWLAPVVAPVVLGVCALCIRAWWRRPAPPRRSAAPALISLACAVLLLVALARWY